MTSLFFTAAMLGCLIGAVVRACRASDSHERTGIGLLAVALVGTFLRTSDLHGIPEWILFSWTLGFGVAAGYYLLRSVCPPRVELVARVVYVGLVSIFALYTLLLAAFAPL